MFLLVAFLFAGCGYTTRGFVYSTDKIFISPAVNKINIVSESRRYSNYRSYPVLLEKRLTNSLINAFNINGHLKVVSNIEESGALRLSCAIKDYNRDALRYSDSDNVEEERLWLKVHVVLTGTDGKKLKEKDITGDTTYFLTGPDKKSESSAQVDLLDDTTRRILELVTESW